MALPRESLVGGGFAVAAFGTWGLLPLYFKAVDEVPALELVAHRAVWSMLLIAGLITLFGRWRTISGALRDRRTLLMLLGSTLFISINWAAYVWAVVHDRVIEVSLGYYINPLINVMLGLAVLRERLSLVQAVAVALAALGVLNLAVQTAGLPWPALAVAFSFGFYGLIRKTTRLDSMEGLFLETLIITPLALGYIGMLGAQGAGHFALGDPGLSVLIVLSSVVTAVPLIWFASAARRLAYVTVGFFQYITPSGQFLLAVFLFGESFTPVHAVTFGCIWTACALVSADTWRRQWRTRRAAAPAAGE